MSAQPTTPEELKACLRSFPHDMGVQTANGETFHVGEWMHLAAHHIERLERIIEQQRALLKQGYFPVVIGAGNGSR